MREHAVLLGAPANPHAHAWRLGYAKSEVLLNELSVRCTSCTDRSWLEVSKREVDVLRIVPLVPVQRGADSASGPAGLCNKAALTSAILDRPTRPSRNVDTDGRH